MIKIYLNQLSNRDDYSIIIDKKDPGFSLMLAQIYWELFDLLQESAPNYSFELEHFNGNEVPSEILEEYRVIYVRGNV